VWKQLRPVLQYPLTRRFNLCEDGGFEVDEANCRRTRAPPTKVQNRFAIRFAYEKKVEPIAS
jgi:hypothetical protein